MAEKLVIKGGKQLNGDFYLAGSRISALYSMAAALLTSEPVVLRNVLHVAEVQSFIELIQFMGGNVEWTSEHELTINALKINSYALPKQFALRSTYSALMVGVLLSRLGKVGLPAQLEGVGLTELQSAGVKVSAEEGYYVAKGAPEGEIITLEYGTPIRTLNTLFSLVVGREKTIVNGISIDPAISKVTTMLSDMGADIEHIDADTIEVKGVESLSGITYKLPYDRCEAVFLSTATLLTKGDVIIHEADTKELTAFLSKLVSIGGVYQVEDTRLRVWSNPQEKLLPMEVSVRTGHNLPSEWLPVLAVLATQRDGTSKFTLDEHISRTVDLSFLDVLESIGGVFAVHNGQNGNNNKRIEIFGPTKFEKQEVLVNDKSTADVAILAGLIAKQMVIKPARVIRNEYDQLIPRLTELGAEIEISAAS